MEKNNSELLLIGVLILALNTQRTESLYPPPTEWNRTYGISDNHDEAQSLIQTDDSGYAMLGFTRHYVAGWVYTEDFWLVKTNSTGNMEWNQTYGGTLAELGYAVVQTVGGGYAMAGYSNYYVNSSYAVIDFWLVKTCSGGDVNGDGVVDIFDLSLVGYSFGTLEGEPGYNPEADLNKDGIIDMRDIAVVCINYGTPP